MADQKFCDVCDMPFDWEGVTDGDTVYCCEGCATGEACTCPQHQHASAGAAME
jgi:hypothetical protein